MKLRPRLTIESQTATTGQHVEPSPSGKRRKIKLQRNAHGKKSTRGTRGALKMLKEMPIDILYEILGHLPPLALLNLARTSKALRLMLLTKSAQFIWKQSLSSVHGLPVCPNDMTEPQYANLAFGDHCHFCLGSRLPCATVWIARVRCCRECGLKNFVSIFEGNLGKCDMKILDIIPRTTVFSSENLQEVQWGTMRYAKSLALSLIAEYQRFGYVQEKSKWLKDKEKHFNILGKHARDCGIWLRAFAEEAQERRYEVIIERLTSLGWGEEISKLKVDEVKKHKLVQKFIKQSKDLTDRSWKSIESSLVSLMEGVKVRRLEEERIQTMQKRFLVLKHIHEEYIASQPLHAVLPSLSEVAFMQLFRSVVENTPSEIDVTAQHFQEPLNSMPGLIQTWREKQDQRLLSIIRHANALGPDATESTLHLATTVFRCKSCRMPMPYEQVIIHICQDGPKTPNDLYWRSFSSLRDCNDAGVPWEFKANAFGFHAIAHKLAISIIRSCGFDPDSATNEELQEANPFVECLNDMCTFMGTRRVMRWRGALLHFNFHVGRMSCYAPLNEEDTKVAKSEELIFLLSLESKSSSQWRCRQCNFRDYLNRLPFHVIDSHGIEDPQILEDYILDMDTSLHIAASVFKLGKTPELYK